MVAILRGVSGRRHLKKSATIRSVSGINVSVGFKLL